MKLLINSEKYLYDNVRDFSIETCRDRALPSVVDGLKSSQRKAIFTREGGSSFIKTCSAAGEMISANIYLHGDSSASGALSAMAGRYSNNYCLLEGKGTFGTKIYPNDYASPRYTYIKLSSFARKVMLIDRDIIPMKDNYDGSVREPRYYLPLIPTVLLNGISGLSVGWKSNILPHKLTDVIELCIKYLDNQLTREISIIPYYKNNDVICVRDMNEPSKYIFKSRVVKLSDLSFKIEELAPGLSLEKVISTLDNLENKGILSSYEDSSKDIIDIRLTFKKGTRYTEEDVLSICKLITTEVERLVVVDFDDISVKQYKSYYDLISSFVEFRKKFFYVRYNNLMESNTKEINYLRFIEYITSYVKDILNYKTKESLRQYLLDLYEKSNINSSDEDKKNNIEKAVNLPIYKFTEEESKKRRERVDVLLEENRKYSNIISSDDNVRAQYKKELLDLLDLDIKLK